MFVFVEASTEATRQCMLCTNNLYHTHIRTYMHIHIHTHVRTYIYVHTYKYINSYLHITYVHSDTQAYKQSHFNTSIFLVRVFIDADKKMYEQYLRSLLGSNKTEIKKVKESNVYKSENIIVHTEDKKETSDLKGNQGKVSSISSDDNSGDKINIEISIENEVESESEAENEAENENENEDFCLLNDGALILVDNTLWKGLVMGQVNEQHSTYDILLIIFKLVEFIN